MTVTILVDPENPADAWWDALRRLTATLKRLAAPAGLTPVPVDADLAPALKALFERLPGWADGPAHAPAPVRLDTAPAPDADTPADALQDARTLLAIATRLLLDAVTGRELTAEQVEAHRRAVNLTAGAAVAMEDLLRLTSDPEPEPEEPEVSP
jgi:hypothetical protein